MSFRPLPALPLIFLPPPLHHADRRQQDRKATGWPVCQSTKLKVESKMFEASRPLIPVYRQSLSLKSGEREGATGESAEKFIPVVELQCSTS